MKLSLIALSLSVAGISSAFADTAYQCTPADSTLAEMTIFLNGSKTIQYATTLAGQLTPKTRLSLDTQLNTPAGYTGYFAQGGCSQTGPGVHCFAIWNETLFVSESMESGSEYGTSTFNGENYDCRLVD